MKLRRFPVFIEEQSIDIVARVRNASENLILFVHNIGRFNDIKKR